MEFPERLRQSLNFNHALNVHGRAFLFGISKSAAPVPQHDPSVPLEAGQAIVARGNQFSRPHVNSAEMPLIAFVQRIGSVILHDLVSRTLWAMEYVRLEGSISLRRDLPSVQRLTRLGSSPAGEHIQRVS